MKTPDSICTGVVWDVIYRSVVAAAHILTAARPVVLST